MEAISTSNEAILGKIFSKKVEVFGIPVVGTSGVQNIYLRHTASVMAEYLDNDEDGIVDDPAVVEVMKDNNALLVMFPTFDEFEEFYESRDSNILRNYWFQDC